MQNVTEYWREINASRICPQTSMTIDIARQDGQHPVITRDNIISFKQDINGNSLSGVITSNKCSFKVKNNNNVLDYDSVNNNDVYANAKVTINYGFKNQSRTGYDEIPGGVFFVYSVDIPSRNDQLSFSCKDILGFMTERYTPIYEKDNALYFFLKVIEQAEKDPNVPVSKIYYSVDEEVLLSVFLSTREDDRYTLAEMLQLIASACSCVCYVDRQGRIVIRKINEIPELYTITNTVQYEPCKISYNDRVGNITVTYSHGESSVSTNNAGDRIGGMQTIDNTLLYDYGAAQNICYEALKILTTGRRMISGKCRIDPRLDIFDTIIVESEDNVFAGVVVSLNMSFNGSWSGVFSVQSVSNPVQKDLRIIDLEGLTIAQLETYMIYQLCGSEFGDLNTISDNEFNYLVTSDYQLILYRSEVQ